MGGDAESSFRCSKPAAIARNLDGRTDSVRAHTELMDMGAVLTAFVAHEHLVGYSPRTIDRRRNTVELFVRALGGATPSREAVEAWLVTRAAAETRRSYLGDLRRFYGWAVTRELVPFDPTVGIQTPRVPVRDPSPLTCAQVAAVRSACRDRQDRLVIGLGLAA